MIIRVRSLVFFLTTFCLLPFFGFGQSSVDWINPHHREILKVMKIQYNKPKDFKGISETECFTAIPRVMEILSCIETQLHSSDEQFIAFMPIYRPLTSADSTNIKSLFPNAVFLGVDRVHESVAKKGIKFSLGEAAGADWRNYVQYYSEKEAVLKFNADTALSYSINLDSQDYYKGTFNRLKVLIIQKRGRGFIMFYCFYTDEAQKDFSKYWKAIEETFRYED